MNSLYENDFNLWIKEQNGYLKNKEFDKLDIENLIKELEEMSGHGRKELVSYLKVLIEHLLKWNYYAIVLSDSWVDENVLNGWRNSIDGPRIDIEDCILEAPNLKAHTEECLEKAYSLGKRKAIMGINRYIKNENKKLNKRSFPETCPWSFNQVTEEHWFPEEPIGEKNE